MLTAAASPAALAVRPRRCMLPADRPLSHRGDDRRASHLLYRPTSELDYDRNDRAAQKNLLRAAYAGCGSRVEAWLDQLDRTKAFYLEGISQVVMNTWSRGPVSLVGDFGYCPGPAVGGGTSLAVVGAYVLAGELTRCPGDHGRAFAAYEATLQSYVTGSRRLGGRLAQVLWPT